MHVLARAGRSGRRLRRGENVAYLLRWDQLASLGRRLLAASACIYVLYACGGRQKDIEEHGAGREGEECYPNGTCDAGLVCYKNRCIVDPDDGVAGEASGGGGSGGGGRGGTSNGGSSGSTSDGGEDTGGSSTGGAGMAGAMSAGSSGTSGVGGMGGVSGNANGGIGGGGASGVSGAGNAGRASGGIGGRGAGGGAGAGRGGGGQGGVAGNVGGRPMGGAGSGGKGGTTGGAGSGTGGTVGGAGSGGTGGVCPPISQLFPASVPTGQPTGLNGTVNPSGAPARSFDGYLLQTPCLPTSCDDCSSTGWVYEGIRTTCAPMSNAIQNFLVGGVPGERYRVTLHFYGVVEPKNYGNSVTRASGTMRPANSDTGANPPPWAYANGNPNYTMSDYNTYEIHVVDNNGMEICSYFLNSDTQEGHWTYVLNYEKTIDVVGGGRVRLRHYDRNCRMIKNCMSGGQQGLCSQTGCTGKARTVDVSAATPQPSGLEQPGLGVDPVHSGQWVYIDVTNVTCGQPALSCSGL